jgi:transcriptional regulator with XRE-family HTH domain
MFWNIFSELCSAVNKKPNAVCKELGFSNATATHWKKGKQPGASSLERIAEYFNVSVDYLLGTTKGKKNKATPLEQPINPKQKILLDISANMSDEDLKKLIEYADLLNLRHNQ